MVLCTVAMFGCHPDMWNQQRLTAHQKNGTISGADGPMIPVAGTVQYDGARRPWVHPVYDDMGKGDIVPDVNNIEFYSGRTEEGALVAENYFPITQELLERGRDRYDINCSACHGYVGDGLGVVTLRGFPNPPSFHIDRLREVEDGHYVDAITNGFGRMYSYAGRVVPEDRWAIAAYIRALQHSQNMDGENAKIKQLVDDGIAQAAAAAKAAEASHGYGDHGHGHDDDTDHGEHHDEEAGHDEDHDEQHDGEEHANG